VEPNRRSLRKWRLLWWLGLAMLLVATLWPSVWAWASTPTEMVLVVCGIHALNAALRVTSPGRQYFD
jgi:hypothetical protein